MTVVHYAGLLGKIGPNQISDSTTKLFCDSYFLVMMRYLHSIARPSVSISIATGVFVSMGIYRHLHRMLNIQSPNWVFKIQNVI